MLLASPPTSCFRLSSLLLVCSLTSLVPSFCSLLLSHVLSFLSRLFQFFLLSHSSFFTSSFLVPLPPVLSFLRLSLPLIFSRCLPLLLVSLSPTSFSHSSLSLVSSLGHLFPLYSSALSFFPVFTPSPSHHSLSCSHFLFSVAFLFYYQLSFLLPLSLFFASSSHSILSFALCFFGFFRSLPPLASRSHSHSPSPPDLSHSFLQLSSSFFQPFSPTLLSISLSFLPPPSSGPFLLFSLSPSVFFFSSRSFLYPEDLSLPFFSFPRHLLLEAI